MTNAYSYTPTEASVQHRQRLSQAFSALRPVKPRVPFWCLAAHRIPVLWTLYRGLLRDAPGGDIRWRIRLFFDSHKGLTSPKQTRTKLLEAQRWSHAFRVAKDGDERKQTVLSRYNSMIAAKREKERMKTMLRDAWDWQHRLNNRSILTGAFLRPSLLHGPLPRMKPQPIHMSRMIQKRKRAKLRRSLRADTLEDWHKDIELERDFELKLAEHFKRNSEERFPSVFRDLDWGRMVKSHRAYIQSSFLRDSRRLKVPYPPELLAAIMAARREKVRNKTRERERQLRGEVLLGTKLRGRVVRMRRRQFVKGPPAHVLSQLSPKERRVDRILREPSQGGYSGMVKLKHRMKLRDRDDIFIHEDGREEKRALLNAMWQRICQANHRKRMAESEAQ